MKRARNFVDAVRRRRVYRSRSVNGQAIRRWGVEAAVMVAAGLVLAAFGPFGTWSVPWTARAGYWLLFALGGYLFFRPVVAAAAVLARHTRLPFPLALFLACAIAAVPTTLLVAFVEAGFALPRVPLRVLAARYPQVVLVGALVTAAQVGLGLLRAAPAAAPEGRPAPTAPDAPIPADVTSPPAPDPSPPVPSAVAPSPPPTFLDRLPPHLGRELLALENEDHYVRAHTALGSALILMRMRDAVAELAGVDGARVHRSWWVARAAVADVLRRDRAVALRLGNGLEVPVARNSVPELRAAGWLQGEPPPKGPPEPAGATR